MKIFLIKKFYQILFINILDIKMQNLDKDLTKLNQDLKLVADLKNHFLKKELEMQDKVVVNRQTLEEVQFNGSSQNRDHSFNLNKKEKNLHLKSALSSKLSEDKLFFIDTFKIDSFKTKDLNKNLKTLNYNSAFLFIQKDGVDKNFKLASSNIPKISLLNQKGINVKDINNL